MSLFPNFTGSEKTWGQSNGGGLTPVLTYPNGLYSAPSGTPLGEPGRTENNNPDETGQPGTATLPISALSDNAQKDYVKGDILFLFKPNRNLEQGGSYATYALWNMNYNLEMAYIKRKEGPPKAQPKESLMKPSRIDRLYDWPITIQEFQESLHYFGIFNTSLDKANTRKRDVGTAHKGYVNNIPAIFPKDDRDRSIGVGDTAWLHVGYYYPAHQGRMNTSGKLEASATVGPYLQVKGMWERDSHAPIGCSKFGKPLRTDADSIVDMAIDQVDLPVDPVTGLVDMRATPIPSSTPLIAPMYQQGYLIKLGRVVKVTKQPSLADIEEALRSESGWKRLATYATVDIELTPCDFDVGM